MVHKARGRSLPLAFFYTRPRGNAPSFGRVHSPAGLTPGPPVFDHLPFWPEFCCFFRVAWDNPHLYWFTGNLEHLVSKYNIESYQWLEVHLYYDHPVDQFLIEAVHPITDTLMQTAISNNFHFIRYEEKGNHIRLRIQALKGLLHEIIQPNLAEHFEGFFQRNPSERQVPCNDCMPDNSLHFFPYQPAEDRFGGPIGQALADKQFGLASSLVLRIMKNNQNYWTYEKALSIALQLDLGFIKAVGFDRKEGSRFFQDFSRTWIKRSDTYSNSPQLLQTFEKGFESQKEAFVQQIHQNWETLESASFDQLEAPYYTWLKGNEDIARQYRRKGFSASELWQMFMDFMHLTHNRLGLVNRDESYLTFLLAKALE